MWWRDDSAALLFEMDIAMMPCLYSNTPTTNPVCEFKHLRVSEAIEGKFQLQYANGFSDTVEQVLGRRATDGLVVQHVADQLPYNPDKSSEDNGWYVMGMLTNPVRMRTRIKSI